MTVNDYIGRMLENNEENPQIIVIYDDNHNIYYFGKAAYAPLNCWFAFKNAHMVGNELRINDIREEENGNAEGKETKIGKSVYDVDIHTVNGWDTYQVNADCLCTAKHKAVLRVINETGSENAKMVDCIRIYKYGTDTLLREYEVKFG